MRRKPGLLGGWVLCLILTREQPPPSHPPGSELLPPSAGAEDQALRAHQEAVGESGRKTGAVSCPQGQENVGPGRQTSWVDPEAAFLDTTCSHPHGKAKTPRSLLSLLSKVGPNCP